VIRAVEDRAAVTPSLLWREIGGRSDFPPLWLFAELRCLGYVPMPAGFWWRNDIPVEHARKLTDFISRLDEIYPDDLDEPC
jgi:hypothetical protein